MTFGEKEDHEGNVRKGIAVLLEDPRFLPLGV
jgi:hypothetical protein